MRFELKLSSSHVAWGDFLLFLDGGLMPGQLLLGVRRIDGSFWTRIVRAVEEAG